MREYEVVWLDVWSDCEGWTVNDWRVIGKITCGISPDDWSVVCKNIVTALVESGYLESWCTPDDVCIEWTEARIEIYDAAEMKPMLNLQEVA